jgi:hypothetical protein
MSARRRATLPLRATVRADALQRAGYRCEATDIAARAFPLVDDVAPSVLSTAIVSFSRVDCRGPLDVDERCSRGVNPGGELDADNVQVLCRAHHEWRTAHPAWAHLLGLRVPSWEQDR